MVPYCKAPERNVQGTGSKETQDGHLPPGAHLQRHHDADGQNQDGKVDEDVGDTVEHAEGLVGGLHAALDGRVEDEERQGDRDERLEAQECDDAEDGPAKRADRREAQVEDEDRQACEGQGEGEEDAGHCIKLCGFEETCVSALRN